MNLAEHCRNRYPWWSSAILFLQMELAIVCADVQDVLGSAIAFRLLFGWHLWVGCVVTGVTTFAFTVLPGIGMLIRRARTPSCCTVMLL